MSSKTKAIYDLLRATYMRPEQLDTLITTWTEQAAITHRKVKSGEALALAKKEIRSDEFLEKFAPFFDKLSISELESLTALYDSEAMKKYSEACKAATSFYEALQEVFFENDPSNPADTRNSI